MDIKVTVEVNGVVVEKISIPDDPVIPKDPLHTVRYSKDKTVLRVWRISNVKKKPIWDDSRNILEPRIVIRDGGEVWVIGDVIKGDSDGEALEVVGPMAIPEGIKVYALTRQLK